MTLYQDEGGSVKASATASEGIASVTMRAKPFSANAEDASQDSTKPTYLKPEFDLATKKGILNPGKRRSYLIY